MLGLSTSNPRLGEIGAAEPVIYAKHQPVTGDSILTVVMDYDDPLSVVLAEQKFDPAGGGL